MPTYEYECDRCGHRFEEFQMYSEAPLKKCPECKKNALRRLFGTGGGIIFKGSGFYQTDYRSEAYKSAAKADQDAGKTAGNGDSKGSDKASEATSGKESKAAGSDSGGKKKEAKSPKSK